MNEARLLMDITKVCNEAARRMLFNAVIEQEKSELFNEAFLECLKVVRSEKYPIMKCGLWRKVATYAIIRYKVKQRQDVSIPERTKLRLAQEFETSINYKEREKMLNLEIDYSKAINSDLFYEPFIIQSLWLQRTKKEIADDLKYMGFRNARSLVAKVCSDLRQKLIERGYIRNKK